MILSNNKADISGFITTANVLAGATFDSGVIDAQRYTQVQTNVISDKDGTLKFIFGNSATMTGITPGSNGVDRVLNIPYSASAGFQMYSAPAFTPYVRYEFTNTEGTDTTHFLYETKLLTKALSPQLLRVDGVVANGMVTNLTRAIATGQQPDGDYVNAVSDGTAFTTTTVLDPGGTNIYTSPWIDTDGFNNISIFVAADQISAVDGIQIEFTDDVQGTQTVRKTLTYSYTQGDVDRGYLEFSFQPKLDGFRLIYTNGSVIQGSFFVQADLRTNIDSSKYGNSGALLIGDFLTEVALGLIPNYNLSTKFGTVTGVDTTDNPITLWALGDPDRTPLTVERKTFNTVADTIYISSSNAADTSISISSIINNSSNNLTTYTTSTDAVDGRTPVSIGATGLDCNTAFVSGNDQTLTGDIYITLGSNHTNGIPNDPTKILAFIPAEAQRTQQATFRVPTSNKMIIDSVHCNMSIATGNADAQLLLRVKPENGSWYILRPYNLTTSSTIERSETMVFDGGTFIEFYMDSGGNGCNMTAIFRYQLIDNL